MISLNVIHYPVYGGPHNRVVRLAPLLTQQGYKTIVLLPRERGDAYERLKIADIPVVRGGLHRLRATFSPEPHFAFFANFVRDINTVRKIIKRYQVGLILICGLVNPHGAIAGALENIPVVWQITDSRTPPILRHLLMRLVSKFADSIMCNGYGLVSKNMRVIFHDIPFFVYYPPVDTSCFYFSHHIREVARRQLGLPKNAFVVGTVANINPQKGIEYFIRAASVIHRTRSDCYFVIIGARYETHWKYNKFIEDELAQSGVPPERFFFLGSKSDIEKYYPLMDVKLITSVPRSEGTTTTALEAMACGIPVVATDVGAVREIVEDGITGFVVPPLEPEKIARATLRLLKNPDLRKHMGETARQRAVKYFDIEVCADTHVRAFEAALEHHLRKKHRTLPNNR